MKLTALMKTYLVVGSLISVWFLVAAANEWKAPNLGILDGSSSGGGGGRSSVGFWGGGK
jgi:hypothetical protein